MTEYKTAPEQFAKFRMPALKALPVFVLLYVVLTALAYIVNGEAKFDVENAVSGFLFFTVMYCFMYYFMRRHQKKVYNSYSLTISDGYLIRRQINMAEVKLAFNDITSISHYKKGLFVQGNQKEQSIVVWPYIEDYGTVETLLSTVQPITAFKYKSIAHRYPQLVIALMLLGMVGLYASNNKLIIATGGLMCISTMGWLFLRIRTATQVSGGSKKLAWLLPLWLIMLIAQLLAKLFS